MSVLDLSRRAQCGGPAMLQRVGDRPQAVLFEHGHVNRLRPTLVRAELDAMRVSIQTAWLRAYDW